MNTHIISIFDKNYVLRALSLYQSAIQYMLEANFWFLCLDNESEECLKKLGLKNTRVLNFNTLGDKELIAVKNTRTHAEFCFTAKTALSSYVLNSKEILDGDVVIWSDADMFFYSTLQPVIEGMKRRGDIIAISPHNFPEKNKHLVLKVGKYNAGFIIFINGEIARTCVTKWRGQCIENCSLDTNKGMVGDQMYINEWKAMYPGVYDVEEKGVNLGPWNIGNYTVLTNSQKELIVDKDPLVCYHFHGIHLYKKGEASVLILPINVRHKLIYELYAKGMSESCVRLQHFFPDWQFGFVKEPSLLKQWKQRIHLFLRKD